MAPAMTRGPPIRRSARHARADGHADPSARDRRAERASRRLTFSLASHIRSRLVSSRKSGIAAGFNIRKTCAMHLGLDLGTSGLRALLIDDAQRVIGAGDGPLSVARPHPGWSEQDPDAWIAAAEAAIGALHRAHPSALGAVRSIGLSGQMHGAALLGADDRPLRPCILWNDTRSHAEAATLDADPRFRAISGNIAFPGFTAPKLMWVARAEPEVFAATRMVLLPKDHLRLWLTGEKISDMSDASGAGWLDVGARAWSPTLLDAGGMRADQMPALAEGSAPAGALRATLAARWGMRAGIVVAGGGGDNAASAVGIGAIAPQAGFVSLGTSGVLFASRDRHHPAPERGVHAFCHALPGAWHQMGVILSASASLEWLGALLGAKPADLTGALGDAPRPPGPVQFLPYLSGERTPHNDSAIRGALVGLSHDSGREALTRAVLDGVAFALRDTLDALRAAGAAPTRLIAVGGGANSALWVRTIANALDLPIDLPDRGEFGAALGAARLGMLAEAGAGADVGSVCTPPAIARSIAPDPALRGAMDDAHGAWRALYPALRGARG
jgi:xylulokinase